MVPETERARFVKDVLLRKSTIIAMETKIKVNVAENPLNGVIDGIGRMLEGEDRAMLRKVLEKCGRPR